MAEYFPIIELPSNLDLQDEPLGSKTKFWITLPDLGRCLFKQARPLTGEDWAERVSAELAALLRLPHAAVELASWHNRRGCLSRIVIMERESLFHGNEVLSQRVVEFPEPIQNNRGYYNVAHHRLEAVLLANEEPHLQLPLRWEPPEGITRAVEVFTGYLLFDAWIGNTDRHHENWAWVRSAATGSGDHAGTFHLCATYDHGPGLGGLLQDQERRKRLETRDRQYTIDAFARKARSAFFPRTGARALLTHVAFRQARTRCPEAGRLWVDRLNRIETTTLRTVLDRIPIELATATTKAFALRMLEANRTLINSALEDMT